jgi:hypothetical protein
MAVTVAVVPSGIVRVRYILRRYALDGLHEVMYYSAFILDGGYRRGAARDEYASNTVFDTGRSHDLTHAIG